MRKKDSVEIQDVIGHCCEETRQQKLHNLNKSNRHQSLIGSLSRLKQLNGHQVLLDWNQETYYNYHIPCIIFNSNFALDPAPATAPAPAPNLQLARVIPKRTCAEVTAAPEFLPLMLEINRLQAQLCKCLEPKF